MRLCLSPGQGFRYKHQRLVVVSLGEQPGNLKRKARFNLWRASHFMTRALNLITLAISTLSLLCSCATSSPQRDGQSFAVKDVPFSARSTPEPRKRIMVLPFLDTGDARSPQLLEEVRLALLRFLKQTDQFVLLSPSDLPKDVLQFKTQEGYKLAELAPLALAVGAVALVEVKVVEVRAKRIGDQVGLFRDIKARVDGTVRFRVYAPKSNRELVNELRSATVESTTTRFAESSQSDRMLQDDPKLTEDVLVRAVQGVVPVIQAATRKLSWEGRIAMVSGDRLYVNAGRLSGLQVGDILKVMDAGEEVFDPDSGDLIGRAPGRVKGTIEVVAYFGKDGAIAVVHSGAGFKEADQVELY